MQQKIVRKAKATVLGLVLAGTLGSAALAKDMPTMTIATGVDPGFSHFYVATQTDILKNQGLDVNLKTGPSGGATIPLLIGDQSNASMAASFAGINNHLADPDIVAVAQVVAYDKWYGVVATSGIKTVQDLKGKRIGITKGTASETMWQALLKHFNLNYNEYSKNIVYVEAPEMLAAIERGNIDAFVNWEPWMSRTVLGVPGTHILVTNEGILHDVGFIYMNRKWIEKNKETAIKFMKGMVETTAFINKKPEETKKIVGKYLNLPPKLMDELLPKLTFSTKLGKQALAQTKTVIGQLIAKGRLKKGEFDYSKWFYPDLLKAVNPALVTLPDKM